MNYERINSIILNIYKECNIYSFPFDCFEILNHYNLNTHTYDSLNEEFQEYCFKLSDDAYSFKDKIFYNPNMPKRRIRFSLMHEFGHIILKHAENRTPDEEAEANYFASNLLIPRMAIHYTKLHNIKELANVFDISLECMEYAYTNYTKWIYGINKYGMTEFDKNLYSHFYSNEHKCFVYNTLRCIYCRKLTYNTKIPICKTCDRPLSHESFIPTFEIARPSLR